MSSKEYAVVLALKATDATSGPFGAVRGRLSRLEGQMSAFSRNAGLHRVAGAFGKMREELGGLGGMGGMLNFAFGPLLALAGGASAGGLMAFAKHAAEMGDELDELSARVGVGTERIQEFQYAAKVAGVDNESFNKALEKFNRNIGEAVNGAGEAKDVFDALGIKLGQGKNILSTERALLAVADSMDKVKTPAERAAVAAALFGKEGAKLAPMFQGEWRELGNGEKVYVTARQRIEELAAKKRMLGVLSEKEAKAAGDFMAKWDDAAEIMKNFSALVGGALLPLFGPIVEGFGRWLAANRDVIASGIGEFVAYLVDVFGFLGGALVDLAGGVGQATAIIAGAGLALMATFAPVTAAVLTLAGLGFVVWKYWEPVKAYFVGIWAEVQPVWEAFFNFISDAWTLAMTPLRAFIAALQGLGKLMSGKGMDFSGFNDVLQENKSAGGRMVDRGKAAWQAIPKEFSKPDFGILPASGDAARSTGGAEPATSPIIGPPPPRPTTAAAAQLASPAGAMSAPAGQIAPSPWSGPGATATMRGELVVKIESPVPATVTKRGVSNMDISTDLDVGRGFVAGG